MSPELPQTTRQRRRYLTLVTLRVLATTTVVIVLYYTLPLNHLTGRRVGVPLGIGILILLGVAAWQLRAVAQARNPTSRAAEALAAYIPLFPRRLRDQLLPDGAGRSDQLQHPTPDPDRHPLLHPHRVQHGRVRRHQRRQSGRPHHRHVPDRPRPPPPRRRSPTAHPGRADRIEPPDKPSNPPKPTHQQPALTDHPNRLGARLSPMTERHRLRQSTLSPSCPDRLAGRVGVVKALPFPNSEPGLATWPHSHATGSDPPLDGRVRQACRSTDVRSA